MREDLIERLRAEAESDMVPMDRAMQLMLEAAAALEAAQKIDRLAATGTVEGFLSLPDDAKRRWFAAHLVESSRRKEAEEALEAAREDAERYRWLRGVGAGRAAFFLSDSDGMIDAAIDQARGKGVAGG